MTTPAAVSCRRVSRYHAPDDPAEEQRVQVPDADVVHDRDRQQQDREADEDRPRRIITRIVTTIEAMQTAHQT